MTDPTDQAFREARQRELDGERTLIEVGPFTALMLIAALQTAHTYPLFRQHGRELYWQVIAALAPALPEDPALRDVISQGEPPEWRTDY